MRYNSFVIICINRFCSCDGFEWFRSFDFHVYAVADWVDSDNEMWTQYNLEDHFKNTHRDCMIHILYSTCARFNFILCYYFRLCTYIHFIHASLTLHFSFIQSDVSLTSSALGLNSPIIYPLPIVFFLSSFLFVSRPRGCHPLNCDSIKIIHPD